MVGRMRGVLTKANYWFQVDVVNNDTKKARQNYFKSMLYWLSTLMCIDRHTNDAIISWPHIRFVGCAHYKATNLDIIHLGVGGAIKRLIFYIYIFPFLYHSFSSYVLFRFSISSHTLLKKTQWDAKIICLIFVAICLRLRHSQSNRFIWLLTRIHVLPTWMRSILFRTTKLRFMWWQLVIDSLITVVTTISTRN